MSAAPDTTLVSGPNFQQIPIGDALITAQGGPQLTLANVLTPLLFGTRYFVAGNYGLDTNDGLSWKSPFLTVAHAMAVSHANIATSPNFANRNQIIISGDEFTENLTAFAQKTDVIGMGSDNGIPTATIVGHHAPVAVAYGCRFLNVNFQIDSGIGVDLVANTGGAQFLGCSFSCAGGTTGIRATGGTDFQFIGNVFRDWSGTAFSTAAISLGTGVSPRTIIQNNLIAASAVGILVNAGRSGAGSIIDNNVVNATGLTINEASSTFMVTRNILLSGAAVGASAYVFAATKAALNYVTGSDKTSIIPALA